MEKSTYGSDMVSIIIDTGLTMAIRYKIIMLGISIDGPSQMMVDNEIVVKI